MKAVVENVPITAVAADAVVVNLFKGVKSPGGATGAVDTALNGAISELIAAGDLKGKLGETATLYTRGALPAPRVIVVGLGDADGFGPEEARRAAAKAASAAGKLGVKRLATIAHGAGIGGLDPAEAAQATAEGSLLALYRFKHYKSHKDDDADGVAEVAIVEIDEARLPRVRAGVDAASATVAGVLLARDLGNQPANTATPTFLAEAAREVAGRYGMRWEAWDRERIANEGMGGLTAVAQGAHEAPRFIILEHAPAGHESDPPVVLVGKAITFDTGGISLKPGAGMGKMKFDMCGGAAVLGAFEAIGRMGLPVRVVGLVASAENMPGGNAIRPGDIITALNGKTIEILNTDAEGRLVLADALSYAGARLTPKPSAVVDLATLTGAIIIALGHAAGGLFGNDDGLAAALARAGDDTGERLWRLPTWKVYGRAVKSKVADLQNVVDKRPSPAGSIFAAKFLEEFVDYPWAHLDIAGVAWDHEDVAYITPGATGFGVRLLVDWLRTRAS